MVFLDDKEAAKQAFGYHLMLDCYQCCMAVLNDITACYNYLDKLVELVGATRQSQPYVFRTPEGFEGKEGLSGWVPLVESGISIHTLTTTKFVSIDLYCCREFDREIVVDFTGRYFKTEEIEVNYVLRGTRYQKHIPPEKC